MHKDQTRVNAAFLPLVIDRVMDSSAEAERDCTVLNRAFLQGPDPLFLMETCPDAFDEICGLLGLRTFDGRAAIEAAHWQGPGVLLGGATGIDPTIPCGAPQWEAEEWKAEALWLILAAVSDTTEEEYIPSITFTERLRRVIRAGVKLQGLLDEILADPWLSATDMAACSLRAFQSKTTFTLNSAGIPVSDSDIAFYLGYKQGHPVVGVHCGDKTFYGTRPGLTLAEQGIRVDVAVSESYGFVRDVPEDTADATSVVG